MNNILFHDEICLPEKVVNGGSNWGYHVDGGEKPRTELSTRTRILIPLATGVVRDKAIEYLSKDDITIISTQYKTETTDLCISVSGPCDEWRKGWRRARRDNETRGDSGLRAAGF